LNKKMATIKQKKFVRGIFKNVRKDKKKSLGKIAREAGYSEGSSRQPGRIMRAKGTRELADKIGLTEEFLLTCLKEDIKAKPKKRERELDMGFKIHGSYAPEKHEVEGELPFKVIIEKGDPTKKDEK